MFAVEEGRWAGRNSELVWVLVLFSSQTWHSWLHHSLLFETNSDVIELDLSDMYERPERSRPIKKHATNEKKSRCSKMDEQREQEENERAGTSLSACTRPLPSLDPNGKWNGLHGWVRERYVPKVTHWHDAPRIHVNCVQSAPLSSRLLQESADRLRNLSRKPLVTEVLSLICMRPYSLQPLPRALAFPFPCAAFSPHVFVIDRRICNSLRRWSLSTVQVYAARAGRSCCVVGLACGMQRLFQSTWNEGIAVSVTSPKMPLAADTWGVPLKNTTRFTESSNVIRNEKTAEHIINVQSSSASSQVRIEYRLCASGCDSAFSFFRSFVSQPTSRAPTRFAFSRSGLFTP